MRHAHILPLALSLFFLTLFLPTQARYHFHKKHKHSNYHNAPEISPSPSPFSGPSSSPPDEAPSPSPSVDENYHNASNNFFDVRAFGAIGDGVTDATESFKMAWDTACQSESPVKVILVPQGLSFVIQSAIFTGPCKGGLVLKVMCFANCNVFCSSYNSTNVKGCYTMINLLQCNKIYTFGDCFCFLQMVTR